MNAARLYVFFCKQFECLYVVVSYFEINLTENSSIVCEVIATVFFFLKTYFKPKIHKTITSN